MEMLHGFLHGSSMLTAIGKCPCDPDSTHGVQAIRVLNDLSLQGLRNPAQVLTEGDRVDTRADPVDPLCRHPAFQEGPRVPVIFRMEQLVIVRVMQEGRKRCDLPVTSWLGFGDPHGVVIDPQGMLRIMPTGIVTKEVCYAGNRLFDQKILLLLKHCF